ncbi:MAG: hypothetical protein Q4A23_00705 [bacterium]|nr:hypothetical protein [bacterium]
MRDIDFDELDRAVNRFLGKPEKVENPEEVTNNTDKLKEELNNIDKTGNDNIVFSRRPAIDAGAFHTNLAERKLDRVTEDSYDTSKSEIFSSVSLESDSANKDMDDKPEVIQVKIKKTKQQIKDNFSEKTYRNHKKKSTDILDNFDNSKFEEPILDDFSGRFNEKIIISPPVISEPQEFEKVMPELESKASAVKDFPVVDKVTAVDMPVADASPRIFERDALPKITVPERPGVFEIEESDDVRVFGAKKPDIQTILVEEKTDENNIDDDIDAIDSYRVDNSIEVPQIKRDAKLEDVDSGSDSLLKTSIDVIKKDDTQLQLPKEKDRQSITEEDIAPEPTVHAPFLQNAKIEKRPLGSTQSTVKQISNFDIKQTDRKQRYDQDDINSEPTTPILSRDEYSGPVLAKKKKTGWGVVIIILLMLIIGGAAGFGAFLLLNM